MAAPYSDTAPSATAKEQYAPATARGRATRQRLLDAAIAEFGDKGFHAASVSAITARAGIGQGTFYIYFGSKEACYAVAVENVSRQLRRSLLRGFGHLQLADCLRDSFRAYLEFCVGSPAAMRALDEAPFVDPAMWREHVARLVRCYADLLDRHAAGPVRTDRDTHALAMVGALQAAAHALLDNGTTDGTDLDGNAVRQSEALATLMLHGLGGERLNQSDALST